MTFNMGKSLTDSRTRLFVFPTRIVWMTEGSAAPEHPGALLEPGQHCCTMHCKDKPVSIVLDYGREIHGGLHLRNGITDDHAPVKVRIRFGESVSEVMGTPDNDHAVHDWETTIPWYGSTEIGNTGFRFVRIDLIDPGRTLKLERAMAVFLYHDLDYRGSFRCDDDRLNQIWDTGAYTVHLCMQEYLWDGIKRDRLVWIGDMHPETMVINTVFGQVDIVPASLDKVRDETPLPQWMNGISSYSLWWVLIHHAWYLYHGDAEYLCEQREYLLLLLEQLRDQIAEDGSERMGGTRFLDWPSSPDKEAIHAGLHALLTLTLSRGAALCNALGEMTHHDLCRKAVAQLMSYTPPPCARKQANALLVLSGLLDAKTTNRTILSVEPFRDLSTFYGYYVLEARAMAGDLAGCLEAIRHYWGGMLDLGATTFWEDFNLDWTENAAGIDDLVPEGMKDIHADFGEYCYKGLRHSLCHGWAAGPTAWMSRHILGVHPIEPGFTKVSVRPCLVGLRNVEGTFPTPSGDIRVRCESNGKTGDRCEVDVPPGVELVDN